VQLADAAIQRVLAEVGAAGAVIPVVEIAVAVAVLLRRQLARALLQAVDQAVAGLAVRQFQAEQPAVVAETAPLAGQLPGGGTLPLLRPARQRVRRHRPRDAEALCVVAADVQQQAAVLDALHALGHHRAVERLRQPDDALHDGEVVAVLVHVADEGLVDLQLAGRQALQVQQRGVAGAEVVEREFHPQFAAGGHQRADAGDVLQRGAFQHLDFQHPGRQRRVFRQQRRQALGEVVLLQMVGGDVDADRQRHALCLPGLHLRQRAAYHPFAERDIQRAAFGVGQEVGRGQQALFRVLPAHQRLGADHPAVAHIDLGLVEQAQLALLQRLRQPPQPFLAETALAVVLGVEDLVAVAAFFLGLVHRLVGVAQQGVRVLLVLRVERDADAGRDLDADVAQLHRLGDGVQYPLQAVAAGLQVGQAGQQQHELVAAEARQGVAALQRVLQPLGDLYQQPVADLVAVAVVDRLEAVQIHEADRQPVAAALRLGDGLPHALGQQHAVGEVGERVVVRHLRQAVFLRLHHRDVGEHRDVVAHIAGLVVDYRHRQQQRRHLAVLAPVPDLALPVAAALQLVAHGEVEHRVVACRLQLARGMADQLVALVAGDAAAGAVDVQQPAAGVGNDDAVVGVLEHAGQQPQPFFGTALLGDVVPGADDAGDLAVVVVEHVLGQDHLAPLLVLGDDAGLVVEVRLAGQQRAVVQAVHGGDVGRPQLGRGLAADVDAPVAGDAGEGGVAAEEAALRVLIEHRDRDRHQQHVGKALALRPVLVGGLYRRRHAVEGGAEAADLVVAAFRRPRQQIALPQRLGGLRQVLQAPAQPQRDPDHPAGGENDAGDDQRPGALREAGQQAAGFALAQAGLDLALADVEAQVEDVVGTVLQRTVRLRLQAVDEAGARQLLAAGIADDQVGDVAAVAQLAGDLLQRDEVALQQRRDQCRLQLAVQAAAAQLGLFLRHVLQHARALPGDAGKDQQLDQQQHRDDGPFQRAGTQRLAHYRSSPFRSRT